ncbi:hypothetical protein Mapa_016329 [Marchantia paleacea]|nr:hypothetical protein Mapa_016329 [Marchantia paleacea]
MFDHLPDTANGSQPRRFICVHNSESKIRLQKSVHHNAVTKLKNLERQNGPGEENERKGKEW